MAEQLSTSVSPGSARSENWESTAIRREEWRGTIRMPDYDIQRVHARCVDRQSETS